MKQYRTFILGVIFFLNLTSIGAAASVCDRVKRPVKVRVNINLGQVYYDNTKSNAQFPAKPYAQTMGLTVAQLKMDMRGSSFVEQIQNNACMGLDELTVNIGFPRIDVYIDKKHRPGTCQYNVIKEHENYHARVQQEGLEFFSSKIKEAFEIAANKTNPELITSSAQGEAAVSNMIHQIKTDVDPLIRFIEKRLKEENLVIDTEEAYRETSKRCKSW